jgi:APA family basic amino acid/polyamine antiporter
MNDSTGTGLLRKPFGDVQRDAAVQDLSRSLGAWHLVFFGVGCIIGSGIFVLTGNAAANFAGPAVLISFLIAGLACGFAALCYAELASTMPVAGSAYTYAYATLGEVCAWTSGWLMVLEFGVASALVAVGFSGYFTSLLRDFGVFVPAQLATPFVDSIASSHGLVFTAGHGVNLVAALAVLAIAALLSFGIVLSAAVNSVMVVVKVTVLVAFVAVGIWWIEPHNWVPFVPANQGGFTYGWPGVIRAASVIFFAYVGFETVSTAGLESRDPRRDLPLGILGALLICTVIYLSVAAVLTGLVPFRNLAVPDPLAVAVNGMHMPWFALMIKLGAALGLLSVTLTTLYGQTRVFYAMSRDGLLPEVFSRISPRWRTPRRGTLIVGSLVALAAALLPISILSDIVSLGTALAFSIVALSVMWLRSTQPDLPRPFRVPFDGIRIGGAWIGIVPVLAILFCILMVLPLIIDIVSKAMHGNAIPAFLLGGYCAVGALVYLGYGRRHSKLRGART